MADVRISQAGVMVIGEAGDAPLNISQAGIMVLTQSSAENINISQAGALALVDGGDYLLNISQVGLMVIAAGRVDDPIVTAWSYSMDGHDFYILRLSDIETLVYDQTTEQWYNWGHGSSDIWRLTRGINWLGAKESISNDYGSNVLAGDDELGVVYILDPTSLDDDDPYSPTEASPFIRLAYAQVPYDGAEYISVSSVSLRGSFGYSYGTLSSDVTLEYSDDYGTNFSNAGTLTIDSGDPTQRIEWYSLGSVRHPGRLFRITDTGALYRLDSLEVKGPPEK